MTPVVYLQSCMRVEVVLALMPTRCSAHHLLCSGAAPQVLRGESYTEKCDVWSFGVVLWEMLQRKRPYAELEMPPFLMMMSLGTGQLQLEPIPDEVATPGLVELVGRCLDRDPGSRPGFREVLHLLELEYRGVRARMAAGEGRDGSPGGC